MSKHTQLDMKMYLLESFADEGNKDVDQHEGHRNGEKKYHRGTKDAISLFKFFKISFIWNKVKKIPLETLDSK